MRVVGGEAGQAIGEGHGAFAILATTLRVAREQGGIAAIESIPVAAGCANACLDEFRQRQRIAQAEVEPLCPDRMDRLCGVADQHGARSGQGLRHHPRDRIGAARSTAEETTGPPAEHVLHTRQEGGVIQCRDRIGFLARHAVHESEMAIAPRQQRGRAFAAETFVGSAVGRALGAQARHEQGLRVIVFVAADAQGLAHPAARAVSGDQQARAQHLLARVVGNADATQAIGVIIQSDEAHRAVAADMGEFGQPRFERLAEVAGDHDPAEFAAAMPGGLQHGAAKITAAADVDARDRAGGRTQLLQHAQRGKGIDGGFGEAEVALVEYVGQGTGGRGLDQAHIEALPVQGDRQAGADQPAADDQDVMGGACGGSILCRTRGGRGLL